MEKQTVGEEHIMASSQPRYTFHIPGYAHLPVSERYMACAFTQKVLKLSKMLLSLGYTVYIYGAEASDTPCTEFVQTHTLKDICDAWGEGDNRFEIGYDWKRSNFKHDFNTTKTETTKRFYQRGIEEINKRKQPDDFLLLMQGQYHKPIADQVGLWLTCEPGVGYRGSYTRFKAFESAYLRNFTYGSRTPYQSVDGDWYDRTIPNYFDPKDFTFRADKEDYYLYIGRLIERKGVRVAVKTVDAIGGRLILAGQGDIKIDSPNCEFVGYVDPPERDRLMGGAKAVFVPTLYLEAFAGVHIEAMLTGTPCITTDFGVFEGTVQNGTNGYRCNTLQDFVDAARAVKNLDPHIVRQSAERYLMDNVKHEFDEWFDDLYQLFRSAHEEGVKGWHYLGDNNGNGNI